VDSDKPLYCRTHTRNGNTQSSSNPSRCSISSPSFGIGYLLPNAYFRSASPPLPPTVVPVMPPIVRDRPLSGLSNMNDLCLPRMEGVTERHSSLESRRIRIGRSDVKLGLPVSKSAPASGIGSLERAVDALLDESAWWGNRDRGFKSEERYLQCHHSEFRRKWPIRADSDRSRPRFRNEAARHSEIIPPTVPR
jgi:hypothetical protein